MRRSALALPLAVLALAPALLPAAAAGQTYLVNRIVLRINDRIATLSDFQRQLGERKQAILAAEDLDEERRTELLSGAGRRVLADLYEEMLLLSRAEQLAMRVSSAELDHAVAQTRSRMGLEDDAQFQQSLAAAGLTEAMLRDRLQRNLLVQQVMSREVMSKVQIEEEELRKVWRDNAAQFTIPEALRLHDVVVLGEDRDPGEVAATARAVHQEIAAGGELAEVAKRWAAEGKTTSEVDLGWVERGDLDPTLERAVWELPVGGLSAPTAGRGGTHILRVAERRAAAVRPFEEVRQEIEARERQRRMGDLYQGYLAEAEKRAHIVLRIPPEAEGFRGLAELLPGGAGEQIEGGAETPPTLQDPGTPPPPPPAEEPAEEPVDGSSPGTATAPPGADGAPAHQVP